VEKAFARYRLMSFVTGTTLLTLCVFLILHTVDLSLWKDLIVPVTIVGIGHGVVLYPIYMVMCVQFALKARLHPGLVVLMLLAGFVPGLAFYMENRVERRLFPEGRPRVGVLT
jgi:integral membrane protein